RLGMTDSHSLANSESVNGRKFATKPLAAHDLPVRTRRTVSLVPLASIKEEFFNKIRPWRRNLPFIPAIPMGFRAAL
ncbi:hypothetical protein, partial [uncultured Ruegeria sp.]|uniref:hypothetical protein n=1 Tax=uncultured Ruegeria sp. TaxID=259304 RepID=UPI00261629E5